MSEKTGNKKKKSSSGSVSSGKKHGAKKHTGRKGDPSDNGGSGVHHKKKKNKLAGRTVELSGQQVRMEEVMNNPVDEAEAAKTVTDVEIESEKKHDFMSAGDSAEMNEIDWRKQIKSISIWTFSVILLALTFFPGESAWNFIHGIILGVLGFKALLWAALMIFFGYLITKQIDEEEILNLIRPVAGIILLVDVLSYILIQSDGYRNVYNELSYELWPLFVQMLNDGGKIGGSGLLGGAIGEMFIMFAGKVGAAIIVSILLTALIMVLTHTGPVDLFNQAKRIIRTLLDPGFYRSLFEGEEDIASVKTVFETDEPFYEEEMIDIDEFPGEFSSENAEEDVGILPDENQDNHSGETDSENSGEEESLKEIVKAVSLKKKKKLTKAEEIKAESEIISQQVESGDTSSDDKTEKEYKYPTVRLLIAPKNSGGADDLQKELTETAEKLIRTLDEYSVKASIADISRGPTVTRYEIKPAPGVKINKIKNLSNDIALRLAAQSIRIEAPIPGKAAVGIEIPNKNKQMVRIREILGSREFAEAKGSLTVALGKDIEGNIVLCDLSKMPHLLIAGSTGSGKSVCVNSMLISLLYKYSPQDVRMVLIDPKSVEFDMYNGIPHLLVPVVCEPKKAAGALQWAVSEMLKRYSMLKEHGVRNIDGYNRLAEQTGEFEKLCRIVIVIDEMADLMIASPKEVEDAIARLAAMARAAGMYMVLATQRPSVDVITGTIKNNIPSRIALAVSSQIDSRTILDEGGAENLIGYGDMLYHPMGSSKHIRVQGCFVDDMEVDRVIKFVKQNGLAEYDDNIADEIERNSLDNAGDGSAEFEGKDEFFEKAVEVVTEAGQASTSMLQRRLGVGYARAGRIIDQLEEHGIIGPHEGSKPRAVLITRTQWMEMTMSRTHSGKNDPIVRSHSEFASQTLDAGHEEITARQSEFFNAENEDDFDDEDEIFYDDTDISDDEESVTENDADGETAESVFGYEDISDNALTEETAEPEGTVDIEPETPEEVIDVELEVPDRKKTAKEIADPSSTPRDFSIFFDDAPDDINDFFDFSANNPAKNREESFDKAIIDIPPWEEISAEKPNESVQKEPEAEENKAQDDDELYSFFELERSSREPKNASDETEKAQPDDDDGELYSFFEPEDGLSKTGNAEEDSEKTQPVDDEYDLHAFSEPDITPVSQRQNTAAKPADDTDDDDFFDDVMSSPWIKKL